MRTTTNDYGSLAIDPTSDVVAGQYGTWRLTYIAGERGIAASGYFRVYTDADTDRAALQFVDPLGPNYMTVGKPTDIEVSVRVGGAIAFRYRDHG